MSAVKVFIVALRCLFIWPKMHADEALTGSELRHLPEPVAWGLLCKRRDTNFTEGMCCGHAVVGLSLC